MEIREVIRKSAFIRFSVYAIPSDYVNINIIMQVSVYSAYYKIKIIIFLYLL